MKKFIAFYYAPAAAMAKMAHITPEQQAEGMKPWFAWKEKCGDAITDFGAPLMPAQNLDAAGNWSQSDKEVTGYSILQGENIETIKALMNGHPHLSWFEGCSIEVQEFSPM